MRWIWPNGCASSGSNNIAFRDNDIDAEVLRRLTGEDLRELGESLIGHHRRLLDAISALGAVSPHVAMTAPLHDVPPLVEPSAVS